MNLYLVSVISVWTPWYDKMNAIVVRAKDELSARTIASKNHGDEGEDVWFDATKTECKLLSVDGPEEFICRDFSAA